MQLDTRFGRRGPRWLVAHFALSEIIYLAYELSLHGSSSEQGLGLVFGLLLAGLTAPGLVFTVGLQWYVGIWLGYAPGDTSPLVPRLIAYQCGIIATTSLLCLLAYVLTERARRDEARLRR